MRSMCTAVIVLAALLTLPAPGLASTGIAAPQRTSAASDHSSTAQAPTHATKGIVQSVDATTLVIRRSPKGKDMKFVLNPSTEREGNLKVGSTVEVRYRTEPKQKVATVVTVEH